MFGRVLLMAAAAGLKHEISGIPLNVEEVVEMLIRAKLANFDPY
jgi:hypothetical protein